MRRNRPNGVPEWEELKSVDIRIRRVGNWVQVQIGEMKLLAQEVSGFKDPRGPDREMVVLRGRFGRARSI
jgi:hypothetical protein